MREFDMPLTSAYYGIPYKVSGLVWGLRGPPLISLRSQYPDVFPVNTIHVCEPLTSQGIEAEQSQLSLRSRGSSALSRTSNPPSSLP